MSKKRAASAVLRNTKKSIPALSEGWVRASGIALGFYAAYQAPRSPSFVLTTIAGLTAGFTLLVYIRHMGERYAHEESVRFITRYVLYLFLGVLIFFGVAMLFGPSVTGIDYPVRFY